MDTRRGRLLRWGIGVVALLVVLAVAVPYLYIHVVQNDPPAELSAVTDSRSASPSSPTVTPTTGAAGPLPAAAGTWITTAGSQAGYRVAEVLAGQDTVAVGRTNAVTGSLTVSGSAVTAGSFSVDLTQVASDSSRRDLQFQSRIMDTATYPRATFTLNKPLPLGPIATAAGTSTVQATGTLALHGGTREVSVPLTAVRTSDGVKISGQISVTFADYGIENPSIGGFVTTEDDGVIEVLLNLSKD